MMGGIQQMAKFRDLMEEEVLGISVANAGHQLLLASLYATVLELSEQCIWMIEAGMHASVPIVQRSILEATADMANLCNDGGYALRMQATHYKELKKGLKWALEGMRQWDPPPEPLDELEAKLAETNRQCDEFAKKGINPLSVFKKFEMAGDKGSLMAIYNDLCNHSHNNLDALRRRHLLERDGEIVPVIGYRWADDEVRNLLRFFVIVLPIAREVAAEFFNLPENDAMRDAVKTVEESLPRDDLL